jgi:hypothetical protein
MFVALVCSVSNFTVKWVTLLLQVPALNLGLKTGYPDSEVFCGFSQPFQAIAG